VDSGVPLLFTARGAGVSLLPHAGEPRGEATTGGVPQLQRGHHAYCFVAEFELGVLVILGCLDHRIIDYQDRDNAAAEIIGNDR
jgi:hypothetical protein